MLPFGKLSRATHLEWPRHLAEAFTALAVGQINGQVKGCGVKSTALIVALAGLDAGENSLCLKSRSGPGRLNN